MEPKLSLSLNTVANYWWGMKEGLLGKPMLKTSLPSGFLGDPNATISYSLYYHHIKISNATWKGRPVILTGPLK